MNEANNEMKSVGEALKLTPLILGGQIMKFSPVSGSLAGYGASGLIDKRTIRLFREHKRDDTQYSHYSDDWDEEDDANGWRYVR